MRKTVYVLAILLFIFSAIFCGFQLYFAYGLWSIAADAAILLALPVSCALHELGHFLFGAMFKIKAVPSFKLFNSSFCKIIPQTDKKLRLRLWFTAFGGLFINLILIVLGIIALFVDAVPVWLCVVAPSSLYLVALNAVPMDLPDGKTDGMVCMELATSSDRAKVTVAVLTVQAQVLNGKPIEEVDEKLLFGVPQIQEDDESFIALTQLRYEYFKSKGDEKNAEKYKNRFEELKCEYLPD